MRDLKHSLQKLKTFLSNIQCLSHFVFYHFGTSGERQRLYICSDKLEKKELIKNDQKNTFIVPVRECSAINFTVNTQ